MITINSMEVYEGTEFIQHAYRTILLREADHGGLAHYLDQLQNGFLRKFDIIVRLRLSPEGKRAKVKIENFWVKASASIIRQIPYIGWLVFLPLDLLRLPGLLRPLQGDVARIHERMYVLQTGIAGDAERRIAWLESHNARILADMESVLDIMAALKKYYEEELVTCKAENQVNIDALKEHCAQELTTSRTESQTNIEALKEHCEQELANSRTESQTSSSHMVEQYNNFITNWEAKQPVPFTELPIYSAFEDYFRGPQALIDKLLRDSYLPFIDAIQNNFPGETLVALDIGCGRGEWLRIMRERGIHHAGVDSNMGMAEQCNGLGLNVTCADVITWLEQQPENSAHIISAFHLIEQLSIDTLQHVLSLAHRALKPGGMLMIEALNPRNIMVGACNFYLDPSHIRPTPSKALSFFLECANLGRIQTFYLQDDENGNRTAIPEQQYEMSTMESYFSIGRDYAIIAYKA